MIRAKVEAFEAPVEAEVTKEPPPPPPPAERAIARRGKVQLHHVTGLESAERDPWRADYTEGRSTWGHDILSFEED